MTIADMLVIFKERFSKFTCSIVNDQLTPHDIVYKRWDSSNKNWLAEPTPKIRVTIAGVETLIFPTEYTISSADGYVTFTAARASTDVIVADYSKVPFTDVEMTSMLVSAVKQFRVLSLHNVDETDIPVNYVEAIVKRAIVIALREIQYPTTKYFAISIAGRAMDKSGQVNQIESLISSAEKDLMTDINAIRYFDKTEIFL